MEGLALLGLIQTLLAHGDGGAAWAELGQLVDQAPARREGADVRFLLDLLALGRCEPSGQFRVPSGTLAPTVAAWERARAHTQIERLRLGRAQPGWARGLRWQAPEPAGAIRWPASTERWDDEAPLVAQVASRCAATPSAPSAQGLFREAQALIELVNGLDAKAPTRSVLLLELGEVAWQLGDPARAAEAVGALSEATLEEPERRAAHLLGALAAAQAGTDTAQDWARVRAESAQASAFVDAHLIASALRANDRQTLELAWPIARQRAGDSAWFLSRAAVVAARLGDEASLFAFARRLIQTRAWQEIEGDPLSAEVAALATTRLATHRFGTEVIELAESLGRPRELDHRIERAADEALRTRHADFAKEAFAYLAERTRNTFLLPSFRARLAVAQLAAGDSRDFEKSYRELVASALASTPRRRRPREWDRQLLFATRDILPLFAEGLGDKKALAVVCDALQHYLRSAGREQTYAELTELYRVASTQLPSQAGPRPYAEKLGATRPPLVLGPLEVSRAPHDPPPPATLVAPPLVPPVSLLCLPRRSECARWAGPVHEPITAQAQRTP